MGKLLYRLKNDKIFLCESIAVCCLLIFDVFMIVFDAVQFAKLSQNSANLFNGFIPLNIISAVVNLLIIAMLVFFVVLQNRKIKVGNKTTEKFVKK